MKALLLGPLFSRGSAFFAGLTALLGKLGVAGLKSKLATLIRTVVTFAVTAAIVPLRIEWEMPRAWPARPVTLLVPSGGAAGTYVAMP